MSPGSKALSASQHHTPRLLLEAHSRLLEKAPWYLFSPNSDQSLQLTISPLRSTAKLPRLSYTSLAITLLGLQSAHAPGAWVIYKPLMYRFNMGLFIIIKRLKASTLAWPPKEHVHGWMECCSLSRQCSHLNLRATPQPRPIQHTLPSKPDWVCLRQNPWYKGITWKIAQKQFPYPMPLKPTLFKQDSNPV